MSGEGVGPTVPVVIWGAGAMGGSIGGWLIQAGHEVLFVDQDQDHVEALNTGGLEVIGPVGSFRVDAKAVLPEAVSGSYHTVLLCVKAHHTEDALPGLAPHLADEGYVVSIQNGLNEFIIAEAVGVRRTVGAFVNFGADLMGPGVVMRGNRGAVVLGELDGGDSPRIRQLLGLLTAFEPQAQMTGNIFGYLWSKLAYGALLFATATTNASIADALAAPSHQPFFVALAREVCAVAHESRIRLEPFDGFDPSAFGPEGSDEQALSSLEGLVHFNRGSAKTHSGIWRDIAVRKRRTEVDAQLGPVIGAGAGQGMATPLTRAVHQMVLEIEQGARNQEDANLAELTAQLA